MATAAPVFLRHGSVCEEVVDFTLPGPLGGWKLSRSYSSRLTPNTTSLGNRWMSGQADKYLVFEGSNIALLAKADSKTVFIPGGNPLKFTPPNDSSLVLTYDATNQTDKEAILTDKLSDIRYVFHDNTVTGVNVAPGKLKEKTTRQWNSQNVLPQVSSGYIYSYGANDKVSQITTPTGQDYNIVFAYSGDLITKVEINDTSGSLIAQIDYTYFENVPDPKNHLGSAGDLVQVKVSRKATFEAMAGDLSIVRYTQYRYNGSSQLTAIYENDAIQRIIAGVSVVNTAEDILNTDNPVVQDFASRRFDYYSAATATSSIATPFATENLNAAYGGGEANESDMVEFETIGAGCATCGGSDLGVTKHYFYMNLHSGASTDQNEVVRLVVEDTVDEAGAPTYRTIYGLNDSGRLLRKAFIKNPTGSPTFWCESSKMATTGLAARLAEKRSPSAHSEKVTDNTTLAQFLDPYQSGSPPSWVNDLATLNPDSGVITVHGYNADGARTDSWVKEGNTGTPNYIWAADFGGPNNVLKTAEYSYPTPTVTRTDGKMTSYAYTFWDSLDREIKKTTTTLPIVSNVQNGSNGATVTAKYYDNLGRLRWTIDGEGYVNYLSYHPVNGRLAYRAVDVDPASPGSEAENGLAGAWEDWMMGAADANKPARGTGLPTALNLVTKTFYDNLSRPRHTEDPGGAEHYLVYENDRTIRLPYWDGTSKTLLPISVTKRADGVNRSETYTVKAGTLLDSDASGPTNFSNVLTQSDYVTWTRLTNDATTGRLNFVDRYHLIPATGLGTLSTDFYRTVTQYDSLGRTEYNIQVVSGSTSGDRKEQVTKFVYDIRGRRTMVLRAVSGDTAANSHDMTDNYDSTGLTFATISKTKYDGGLVGDGLVTKTTEYHSVTNFTGINYKRTYLGHLRGIEPFFGSGMTETPIGPYTVQDVDWQGKTTATAQYDALLTWSTVLSGDEYVAYAAAATSTNRRTLDKTLYDDLGRLYRTERYEIAASDGSGTNHFTTDTYRDRNGRPVATSQKFGSATETAYDGAGRRYQTRTVLDLEAAKYSGGAFQYSAPVPKPTIASMTGGDARVISLVHQELSKTGTATEQHTFEANHDEVTGVGRGIDLSGNDDYVRRSVYNWYDAADRLTTSADYGSGDTLAGAGTWKYADPPNPTSAPTISSDTVLVTLYAYNPDSGRQELVTDPMVFKTKTFYDDLGRTTYVAENFDNFDAVTEGGTGDAMDKSKDRVTSFIYNGLGQRASLTAMDANADGDPLDNQTTTYLYEDPVAALRVTSEIYPDSSDTTSAGSDQVKMEYATDGLQTKRTDQRGTVIETMFNDRRQLDLAKVTALGGADPQIQSIGRTYDNLARLVKITSYAAPTGPGSAVRNEVQLAYNDLGQVTTSYQSHQLVVNTGTTPKVQYAYDTDTDASTGVFKYQHRLQSVTYPNDRVVFYDYDKSQADNPANRLSRVHSIRDTVFNGPQWSVYDYNGTSRLAGVNYPGAGVKLDYLQGTPGTYAGLDRFGRVKDQYWDGDDGMGVSDADRFKYGHDFAGNRTYRDIDATIYATNDQAYVYDGLHRLKSYDDGTWNGTAITTVQHEQDWSLDAQGNWSGLVAKTTGTIDLNQSRTSNDANEITDITETTGPSWITPGHDAAGNMTVMPAPTNPIVQFDCTYDAWNRLMKVTVPLVGGATFIDYEYDGLNRRIIKRIAPGSNTDTQHFYYNENWQVLEVRKETPGFETEAPDPLEQYVWHPYYVDALATRFYDPNIDGQNVQQHYFTHDANFNVTAAITTTGTVIERYHYTPYGELTVLDPSFAPDGNNLSDIENPITYTGRRYDGNPVGLYYYRNRYYHAQLGRFVTRDPIGYLGSDWNLYEYVSSNPPGLIDPMGQNDSVTNAIRDCLLRPLPAAIECLELMAHPRAEAALKVLKLRRRYQKQVRWLRDAGKRLKREGWSPEKIARELHKRRRALGDKFKGMTPKKMLDEIVKRNIKKYGDPKGPTIKWLREVGKKTWRQIADSASRPGGKDALKKMAECADDLF